ESLCARPPQRIGLSATQKPLEEIAKFLGGCHPERSDGSGVRTADPSLALGMTAPADPSLTLGMTGTTDPSRSLGMTFRRVTIVDCGLVKKMDVSVRSPVEDLGRVGGTIWPSVAPLVLNEIRKNRTTIVFVNNRAQSE